MCIGLSPLPVANQGLVRDPLLKRLAILVVTGNWGRGTTPRCVSLYQSIPPGPGEKCSIAGPMLGRAAFWNCFFFKTIGLVAKEWEVTWYTPVKNIQKPTVLWKWKGLSRTYVNICCCFFFWGGRLVRCVPPCVPLWNHLLLRGYVTPQGKLECIGDLSFVWIEQEYQRVLRRCKPLEQERALNPKDGILDSRCRLFRTCSWFFCFTF